MVRKEVAMNSPRSVFRSGNPLMEEAALRAGQAFVKFAGRAAVVVNGPDRLGWLNNLTTAPLVTLKPGSSMEGLILDPAGHVSHAFAAVDSGEATWLLPDEGRAQALADFLESMRFMMRVEISIRPVAVYGTLIECSQLPEAAVAHARYVWEDPWPRITAGGTHYGLEDAVHPARDVYRTAVVADLEQSEPLEQALEAAGLQPVSEGAWEAARVVDFRPRPNREILAEGVLPHELDWLRTAVWLNKGCFPGQETVAKVVNMGKPPRRLVFLYLEGPDGDLPAPGAGVSTGGAPVGVLTSVALDYEKGPVALALLKRTVPLEAVLTIDGGQGIGEGSGFIATQEMIVSPEGRSAASPKENPAIQLRRARAAMGEDQKPKPRGQRE